MNRNKRQRDIQSDNSNNRKKKKIQCNGTYSITTADTHKDPVTSFEDLSNEIIHDIFEYLDSYNIYRGFFNLTLRFQRLFTHSNIPIKLNVPYLSKAIFEKYYNEFIQPNKYRIQSMHLLNPFEIEYFCTSSEDIFKYQQLQTLILGDIERNCLEHLLNGLSSLSNFTSLTVRLTQDSRTSQIYNLIFQLPFLKYCEIDSNTNHLVNKCINWNNVSNTIEHLAISYDCSLGDLPLFFSHVPNLRRLSTKRIRAFYNETTSDSSFATPYLTFASLKIKNGIFKNLEQFIKSHFQQVQVLYISTGDVKNACDARQWEQIISFHMPNLRKLDLQIPIKSLPGKMDLTNEPILNEFSSLFWLQNQWIFRYEYYIERETNLCPMLYSNQSYRRKYFVLTSSSDLTREKMVFTSVRHVIINDVDLLANCSKHFPHINELTLTVPIDQHSAWFASDHLESILSLAQLTILNIDTTLINLERFVALLIFTPNLHTLSCKCVDSFANESIWVQRSKNFRLVSDINKIKKVSITDSCPLKVMKILFDLCPGLENFTTAIVDRTLIPTLIFLFWENDEIRQHLSSLCIARAKRGWYYQVKGFLDKEKLVRNYSIKAVGAIIYLWW